MTDSKRTTVDRRTAANLVFLDIEGVREETVAILLDDERWSAPVVLVRETQDGLVSGARLFSLEEMLVAENDWATSGDGLDQFDTDAPVAVEETGEWDIVCIAGVVRSAVAIDRYNDTPHLAIHTTNPEEPDHYLRLPTPVTDADRESARPAGRRYGSGFVDSLSN